MNTTQIKVIGASLLVAICFGLVAGFLVRGPFTEAYSVTEMTANGTFDRVELVDRHYGNINGQEVEGDVLAVLYQNGSVEISTDHYEIDKMADYYRNGTNYCFFLYVYDAEDHLRERISVVGGTTEEYVYLNVIVTISLDFETELVYGRHFALVFVVVSVGVLIMILFMYDLLK